MPTDNRKKKDAIADSGANGERTTELISSEDRSNISDSQRTFLVTIDTLLSNGHVTHNIHAMLKDLIKYKDSAFFNLICLPSMGGMHCRLDHMDDIVDSKIRNELESLYRDCTYETARNVSMRARAIETFDERNLYYGEVDFSSFSRLMRSIQRIDAGDIFYDLGSGSGRAVFAARFTGDFDRCIGIELIPTLHDLAAAVKITYDAGFKQRLSTHVGVEVEFHCDDFLQYDWSNGKVIFVHSTCFGCDLLDGIILKAESLKQGSYLIITTAIESPVFEFVEEKTLEMSWGLSDAFIYRRF